MMHQTANNYMMKQQQTTDVPAESASQDTCTKLLTSYTLIVTTFINYKLLKNTVRNDKLSHLSFYKV